ncbi:18847_t:CDS:2, partial [Rhizophagus irregularis]
KCGVGKALSIVSKEVWGISAAGIEQTEGLQNEVRSMTDKERPNR